MKLIFVLTLPGGIILDDTLELPSLMEMSDIKSAKKLIIVHKRRSEPASYLILRDVANEGAASIRGDVSLLSELHRLSKSMLSGCLGANSLITGTFGRLTDGKRLIVLTIDSRRRCEDETKHSDGIMLIELIRSLCEICEEIFIIVLLRGGSWGLAIIIRVDSQAVDRALNAILIISSNLKCLKVKFFRAIRIREMFVKMVCKRMLPVMLSIKTVNPQMLIEAIVNNMCQRIKLRQRPEFAMVDSQRIAAWPGEKAQSFDNSKGNKELRMTRFLRVGLSGSFLKIHDAFYNVQILVPKGILEVINCELSEFYSSGR